MKRQVSCLTPAEKKETPLYINKEILGKNKNKSSI